MKKTTKYILASLLAVSSLSASAASVIPEEVTTMLSESKADVLSVGGSVLLIVVAIAAFRYIKHAL